jgi:hypothetical protein
VVGATRSTAGVAAPGRRPNGIAKDANGHVVVVDRYNHRVQKFGRQ